MGVDIAVSEIDVFADVSVGIVGGCPMVGIPADQEQPPYPACALEALAEVETPDVVGRFGVGGEDVDLVNEIPGVVEIAGVRGRSPEVRDQGIRFHRFADAAALTVVGIEDAHGAIGYTFLMLRVFRCGVIITCEGQAVLTVPLKMPGLTIIGKVAVVVVDTDGHGWRHGLFNGLILVQGIREVEQRVGRVGRGDGRPVADLVKVVGGGSVSHGCIDDFIAGIVTEGVLLRCCQIVVVVKKWKFVFSVYTASGIVVGVVELAER